jgi:hypothetical protein
MVENPGPPMPIRMPPGSDASTIDPAVKAASVSGRTRYNDGEAENMVGGGIRCKTADGHIVVSESYVAECPSKLCGGKRGSFRQIRS